MIDSKPAMTSVQAKSGKRPLNGAANTGTAPAAAGEEYTYIFPYREPSSYSHVVDLARRYVAPGTVIDLGAGAGTIGEPLERAGFTYVAVERHPGALRLLQERHFRSHAADLADTEALRAILDATPDAKAWLLIDVLEHLHEPEALLTFLSEYARARHAPYLLVSVPNVAHRDVAFNLLRGQWNITEHGLLDKTHISYYTRRSLLTLLNACGWQLVTSNDFALDESDQYDPDSILHTNSLIGDALRYTTKTFNPDHTINQFIWLLKPASEAKGAGAAIETVDAETVKHPLVSILIRTQGTRNELLLEALFAAFAQDCDDYEIVICFHNPNDADGQLLQGVNHIIATVPVALRRAIRVIVCTGAGRSAPLNQLFEDARGEYLTILDDDDLLFPRHVSMIKKGVEQYGIGPMFQTFAVQRMLDVREEKPRSPQFGFTSTSVLEPKRTTATYPYTVQSIEMMWVRPFDPLTQQYANSVHVSCFVVPKRLIEQTHLRFRNDFEYGEDWQFWMEASQILNVVTLPEITGVQNVRTNGTNTVGNTELQPEWISSHRKRFAVQEEHPLILDGRTARLIYRRHLEETAKKAEMDHHFSEMHRDLSTTLNEYGALSAEYERVGREYNRLHDAYEEQSAWARSLERQLQSPRHGLVRRVIGRVLRK